MIDVIRATPVLELNACGEQRAIVRPIAGALAGPDALQLREPVFARARVYSLHVRHCENGESVIVGGHRCIGFDKFGDVRLHRPHVWRVGCHRGHVVLRLHVLSRRHRVVQRLPSRRRALEIKVCLRSDDVLQAVLPRYVIVVRDAPDNRLWNVYGSATHVVTSVVHQRLPTHSCADARNPDEGIWVAKFILACCLLYIGYEGLVMPLFREDVRPLPEVVSPAEFQSPGQRPRGVPLPSDRGGDDDKE
mmetsp:Transcript_18691/g.51293  ORF Transcript_18691/g.51293 Transcript_18691/m.51293 type:complete len:248 (-) Transcript_18691:826-1569(-)